MTNALEKFEYKAVGDEDCITCDGMYDRIRCDGCNEVVCGNCYWKVLWPKAYAMHLKQPRRGAYLCDRCAPLGFVKSWQQLTGQEITTEATDQVLQTLIEGVDPRVDTSDDKLKQVYIVPCAECYGDLYLRPNNIHPLAKLCPNCDRLLTVAQIVVRLQDLWRGTDA